MNNVQVVLALLGSVIFGAACMYASIRFRKSTGELVLSETEEGRIYTLRLEEEPEDLVKRRYILFRVSRKA